MSSSRYIVATVFDFTSDACLIIHGEQGEHLIVKMGFAQVANLDRAIAKYVDQYKPKEGI